MPVEQSPSPAQLVRQPVVPLQTYGAQLEVADVSHTLLAHTPGFTSVEELLGHEAGAQVVPSAYFWQPPAPLHLPFVLHDVGPRSVQNVEGAGVPAATGAHAPVPVTLHAWQAGQLGLPQQTPSTQLPLMHWLPDAQARPLAFSAQFPAPWQV